MPKEGFLMRIRLLLPILSSAALLGLSASGGHAGSFFGPCCYGSDYAYQYPNRANNVIGCGQGQPCQARHPFFHRLFRRNKNDSNDGMAANAMPGYGMPTNGMPMNGMPMNGMPANGMAVNGMPAEYMQAPVAQSQMLPAPFHTTSIAPAPVPAMPAVQSRLSPMPAPMPSGPANAEPPALDPSGKPPF
jgi:hypothetical protein